MRLLHRSSTAPVYVAPGDSIELRYMDEHGEITKVATEIVDTPMAITEWAITEHEQVPELGMGRALAGWFGEDSDQDLYQ